jgi:hypothetical protein
MQQNVPSQGLPKDVFFVKNIPSGNPDYTHTYIYRSTYRHIDKFSSSAYVRRF